MKFCVQIFFTNDKNHTFFVDCENEQEMREILISYQNSPTELVMAGIESQPCLFNPKNVMLVVASIAQEVSELSQECCAEERCH